MSGALRRLWTLLLLTAVMVGVLAVIPSPSSTVSATADTGSSTTTGLTCDDGSNPSNGVCMQTCPDGSKIPDSGDCAASGAGNCSNSASSQANQASNPNSGLQNCDLITDYINPLINFLAAAVGVVVVIAIIISGIQYSASSGDPQKAATAKNHIRSAIIALIAFFLLYGMLDFLIPGGLF